MEQQRIAVKGERKVWIAYLLWPTFIGHRWYLGKLSPVYFLTFGYFGFMWLADFFRIPEMVREYNAYVYQRAMARGASDGFKMSDMGGASSPGEPREAGIRPAGEQFGGAGEEFVGGGQVPEETSGEAPGEAQGWIPGEGRGPSGPRPPLKKFELDRKKIILGVVIGLVIIVAIVASAIGKGGNQANPGEAGSSGTVSQEAEQKLTLSLITRSGQTYSTPNVTLEGTTEPFAWVTIKGCVNEPVHVQAGADGKFSAPLVLAEGFNYLTIKGEKGGRTGEASFSCTYQVDEATYKAQCQPMEFRVLNKNPDAYKGQKYYTVGQVVQVLEEYGSTDIRLNVTRDQWGYWDDTIYVTYSGSVPAYEDSIIKIWGEIQGSYTYESIAGWTITLPLVKAKYIEVVKQ
jgi:hypothetical protein